MVLSAQVNHHHDDDDDDVDDDDDDDDDDDRCAGWLVAILAGRGGLMVSSRGLKPQKRIKECRTIISLFMLVIMMMMIMMIMMVFEIRVSCGYLYM